MLCSVACSWLWCSCFWCELAPFLSLFVDCDRPPVLLLIVPWCVSSDRVNPVPETAPPLVFVLFWWVIVLWGLAARLSRCLSFPKSLEWPWWEETLPGARLLRLTALLPVTVPVLRIWCSFLVKLFSWLADVSLDRWWCRLVEPLPMARSDRRDLASSCLLSRVFSNWRVANE